MRFSLAYIVILAFSAAMSAQKPVVLAVSHFLGTDSFALERPFKNNLDYEVKMSRFDYYISNVTLYHDGGKELKVPDLYILSRDGKNFNKFLGNFSVDRLDSIAFYVGVDSVNNHADPALWPAGHALAPTFPDMHWGWAAGYRFSAIEGNNGPDFFYQYQLHPIGDELFYRTVMSTPGKTINDTLLIGIKADCANAVDNINFSKVVFDHGAGKDAVTIMKNFSLIVFSPIENTSNTPFSTIEKLTATPNPSLTTFLVNPSQSVTGLATLYIFDQMGKMVSQQTVSEWPFEVKLDTSGTYVARIVSQGKVVGQAQLVRM